MTLGSYLTSFKRLILLLHVTLSFSSTWLQEKRPTIRKTYSKDRVIKVTTYICWVYFKWKKVLLLLWWHKHNFLVFLWWLYKKGRTVEKYLKFYSWQEHNHLSERIFLREKNIFLSFKMSLNCPVILRASS